MHFSASRARPDYDALPMSKAFTREDDDAPEPVAPLRASSALPPGAKNYVTADGAERFRAELARLIEQRGAADVSRTQEKRIAELQGILATAEVVETDAMAADQVRFGMTVTVREAGGEETRYRIVGVDEADFERGAVSWLSPIARALMNERVGQRVNFQSPAGERKLEVISIDSARRDGAAGFCV